MSELRRYIGTISGMYRCDQNSTTPKTPNPVRKKPPKRATGTSGEAWRMFGVELASCAALSP